jgi:hypothetical protein
MWHVGKPNPFKIKTVDLTPQQIRLLSYSKMYDSIYKNPDCPSDLIIKEDDMLDGWMIVQNQKADKDKNKKTMDEKFGDGGDSQDIFLPVTNQAALDKVNQMNSMKSKMIKKQRESVIKQVGKVREENLPDIQLDANMQAQRQFMEGVKGK